jgi:hypothetical protein
MQSPEPSSTFQRAVLAFLLAGAACAGSPAANDAARAVPEPKAAPRPPGHATPQAAAPAQPVEGKAGALEIGDPYYPGLGNGGYDVDHYTLELEVDPVGSELDGHATLRARALDELASFSLDLYGLDVENVLVDGKEAHFERPEPAPAPDGKPGVPSELVIRPREALHAGKDFETVVQYGGTPKSRPDPSVPFFPGIGWTPKESGVYVISECIGASSWFPCNDHPRDNATYDFRITVDKPYTVAANGLLREVKEDGDRRTFVFEARPDGDLPGHDRRAEFDVPGRRPAGHPVRIYHPVDATGAGARALPAPAGVLAFLESVFGPYPFVSAGRRARLRADRWRARVPDDAAQGVAARSR